MDGHLFSEVSGYYKDFMGMQYRATLDNKEVVEWRNDGKCGLSFTNSLKSPAKCKEPLCCVENNCVDECPGQKKHPPYQ